MPREIRYEKKYTARLTPCPYKVKTTICFGVEAIVNVASTDCERCKHFQDDNEETQIVMCSYEEEK